MDDSSPLRPPRPPHQPSEGNIEVDLIMGFVHFMKFGKDSGTFRGGVLVMDKETKPIEFRVTAPITPTQLQRTLYGNYLDEFIIKELITTPLLDALTNKPQAVIVRERHCTYSGTIPILLVEEVSDNPNGNDSSTVVRINKKIQLTSLISGRTGEVLREDVKSGLISVFSKKDILEPFERITNALDRYTEETARD